MEGTVPYANFRAWVPRKVLPVGTLHPQDWVYYEWGPKQYAEPLVCLHGLVGSAESFFLQMLDLADRGYRVFSIQLPTYWSVPEFCDGFQTFLDMVQVRRIHLYGAGLGGFLAMQYAARRPERVASVLLTHAFLSTVAVSQRVIYSSSILRWLPDLLVRSAVRSMLPKGRASRPEVDAAEFSIVNTMSASRNELASRLSLLSAPSTVVGRVRIPEECITTLDVVDIANYPGSPAQEELRTALPNVRRALIKSGGDFPYLSQPEDITLHIVVHLRRTAATPVRPLPLPPPAKPIPMEYLRRNIAVEPKREAESNKEILADSDSRDIRVIAEERVDAAEQQRKETFAFELVQIRKYIKDLDEAFLLAVIEDCDGNVDRSVQRIRDGQYKKNFYLKTRRKAVRVAIETLKSEEEDNLKSRLDESAIEDDLAASMGNSISQGADSPKIGVDAAPRPERPRAPLDSPGPLCGSTEIIRDMSVAKDALTDGSISPTVGTWGIEASGVLGFALGKITNTALETVPLDEESSIVSSGGNESRHGLGDGRWLDMPQKPSSPRQRSASFASIVEKDEGRIRNPSGQKSPKYRARSQSHSNSDSVNAYVSSEKVGMRAQDHLIGRGPAPFAGVSKNESSSIHGSSRSAWNNSRTPVGMSEYATILHRAALSHQSRETRYDTVTDSETFDISDETLHGGRTGEDEAIPRDVMNLLVHEEVCEDHSTSLPFHGGAMSLYAMDKNSSIPENDDDGWSEFRRLGGLSLSTASTDQLRTCNVSANVDSNDDAARLREWMLSAQSANEYALRK